MWKSFINLSHNAMLESSIITWKIKKNQFQIFVKEVAIKEFFDNQLQRSNYKKVSFEIVILIVSEDLRNSCDERL